MRTKNEIIETKQISIDPTDIKKNSIEEMALSTYLQKNNEKYYPLKDRDDFYCVKNYEVLINYEGKDIHVTFQLGNTIIWREQTKNKKLRSDRYEILGNQLGGGGSGCVYWSKGTLVVYSTGSIMFKRKTEEKKRAIKIVETLNNQTSCTKFLSKESIFGLKTKHLHAKKATMLIKQNSNLNYDITAINVIRLMQGDSLYSILQSINKGQVTLGLKRIYDLTIELLKALETQIHEKGIIHRDIKPGNIMVKFEPTSVSVNIIDLGFSKDHLSDDRGVKGGTPGYNPPELKNGSGTNEKSDIFSMAKVLNEIWYLPKKKLGLEVEVTNILDAMLSENKEQRISLKQAIECFEKSISPQLYMYEKMKSQFKKQGEHLASQLIEILNHYLKISDLNDPFTDICSSNLQRYAEAVESFAEGLGINQDDASSYASLKKFIMSRFQIYANNNELHEYIKFLKKIPDKSDFSDLRLNVSNNIIPKIIPIKNINNFWEYTNNTPSLIQSTSEILNIFQVRFTVTEKNGNKSTYQLKDILLGCKAIKKDSVNNKLQNQKNGIINAIESYLSETFSPNNLYKHDRAASPRRMTDMKNILNAIQTARTTTELLENVKSALNEMDKLHSIGSLLKKKVTHALKPLQCGNKNISEANDEDEAQTNFRPLF